MFDRFSGQARQAIQIAWFNARRQGCDHVGTEHLLAGLIQASRTVREILRSQGVDPSTAIPDWESSRNVGTAVALDKLPLTPSIGRVFEQARAEAAARQHVHVGPEHLLVALLLEPNSTAAERIPGLDVGALRAFLVERPEPENRDQMVQVAPSVSGVPDPSPESLSAIIASGPIPASASPKLVTIEVEYYRRIFAAIADRNAVSRQLRMTQNLLGASLGASIGSVIGARAALAGGVLGFLLARTQIPFLRLLMGIAEVA